MATTRMTVTIDPHQIADLKEFVRKENSRQVGLTPALADLALSLSGWTETTGPNDQTRTFVPGVSASDEHPAAQLARLRRRLDRLAENLEAIVGPSMSVATVQQQIQDILR